VTDEPASPAAHPPQPSIGDYALLSDSHAAALVSSAGSIDWCGLPRLDSSSCFTRLLDAARGGSCSIEALDGEVATAQRYVDDTLVTETRLRAHGGAARVLDFLAVGEEGPEQPQQTLVRIVEGVAGTIELRLRVSPRFDYGRLRPWLRRIDRRAVFAVGGDDALLVAADTPIDADGEHDLRADFRLRRGERRRFVIRFLAPARTEERPELPSPEAVDDLLDTTVRWWRGWARRCAYDGPHRTAVLRSALTLRGLVNARTGAIAAAPTTSLPEATGGVRNWDYRFSWIRDSSFSVRSLAELGFVDEADGFARFVIRSAAGSVDDLQVFFGLGGERHLDERELPLSGYRGARPVRIGNAAAQQVQLDALGQLLNLVWRRHRRGATLDDDQWRFVRSLVDAAADRWQEPDRGIWEWRDGSLHFTLSKAACWSALHRGLQLAAATGRPVPTERWIRARDDVRRAVERRGWHASRGAFTQAFDNEELDAALLLLPHTGFLAWDDPRMVATTDRIAAELDDDGLLRRYTEGDGLPGREGAFLACSFWLAECLARQGRDDEARRTFQRAAETASPLGLFSEEYDTAGREPAGNYPQALTHLSHIGAALALAGHVPPEDT
jgi:GH15 family glucan-1,4-alpha-glucosidase